MILAPCFPENHVELNNNKNTRTVSFQKLNNAKYLTE